MNLEPRDSASIVPMGANAKLCEIGAPRKSDLEIPEFCSGGSCEGALELILKNACALLRLERELMRGDAFVESLRPTRYEYTPRRDHDLGDVWAAQESIRKAREGENDSCVIERENFRLFLGNRPEEHRPIGEEIEYP